MVNKCQKICHFDERWNKRNNESTKILNAQNEQKVQRAPKEDGEVKVEAFEWFFEPTWFIKSPAGN